MLINCQFNDNNLSLFFTHLTVKDATDEDDKTFRGQFSIIKLLLPSQLGFHEKSYIGKCCLFVSVDWLSAKVISDICNITFDGKIMFHQQQHQQEKQQHDTKCICPFTFFRHLFIMFSHPHRFFLITISIILFPFINCWCCAFLMLQDEDEDDLTRKMK